MKSFINHLVILFLSIFHIISCSRNLRSDDANYCFLVSVEEELGIEKDKVEAAFSKFIEQNSEGKYLVEIVIYGYSSGKETFFYSENGGNVLMDTKKGSIEALVKVKQDMKIKDIYFLKAIGNAKDEIIESLALEAKRILFER